MIYLSHRKSVIYVEKNGFFSKEINSDEFMFQSKLMLKNLTLLWKGQTIPDIKKKSNYFIQFKKISGIFTLRTINRIWL